MDWDQFNPSSFNAKHYCTRDLCFKARDTLVKDLAKVAANAAANVAAIVAAKGARKAVRKAQQARATSHYALRIAWTNSILHPRMVFNAKHDYT